MGVTTAGWQQELMDTLQLQGIATEASLADASISVNADPAITLDLNPEIPLGSGDVNLSSDAVNLSSDAAIQLDQRDALSRSADAGGPLGETCAILLRFAESPKLVLHLIPIDHHFLPADLLKLQESFKANNQQLIQLWEDVWLKRPDQVLSRITAMLGKNKTVHGRKTKIITVTQVEADNFFGQYHLQFSAKARHRFALTLDGEVVAMASFSAKRNMTKKREGYTSVELIRFATVDGITVQGGLSKLIRHMIKTIGPDDVMTYADLDWSYGKGYTKLGFELTAQTPPAEIWINTETLVRYFPQRLPADMQGLIANLAAQEASGLMEPLGYRLIYNTGNLKYILYLSGE